MTPATFNIELIIGARFQLALEFQDAVTLDPIDLTNRVPFVAQVRRSWSEPIVLTFDITDDDLPNGQISLMAEPFATSTLVEQNHEWDLIDATGTIWMRGDAPAVQKISSTPP